jgi:hypothetical protein
MENQKKRFISPEKKFNLFIAMAITGIIAIVIGFSRTFLIPLAEGTKSWPIVIYVHGAFAFGWVLLFLIQSVLIKTKNYKTHMTLGRWGFFIAIGAAVTIIPAGLYQIERELKEGFGQTAILTITGVFSSALIFLSFVTLAIYFRKKPQAHKRFMLLATIVLLWPAWFRWRHYFPSVTRPDIWFGIVLADSLIIIAFIWDWLKNKKIHPVLLYGGLFFIIENVIEIILFDTPVWRAIASFLYNILS